MEPTEEQEQLTQLQFDLSIYSENAAQQTSSMDRYEIKPFGKAAEELAARKREKEKQELKNLKTAIFLTKSDINDKQIARIHDKVFEVSSPLVREKEVVAWDRTEEFGMMSVCIFISLFVAVVYFYTGRKKKERERRLIQAAGEERNEWQESE